MMSPKRRFIQIWNGIALILFFAAIFLDITLITGVSSVLIAVFMWIIGGTVASMIFGKNQSSDRVRNIDKTRLQYPMQNYCESCGAVLDKDAQFCSECGTIIDTQLK